MFFNGWYGITRILIVGVLAYVALIVWLRISGKRTLSKWNAFDFVVTVALGSTLASVILNKDVPLAEGVAVFALLVLLQFVITSLAVRAAVVRRLIKSEPTLLVENGEFIREAMLRQRVTEGEIKAAIRKHGSAALDEIAAVVLETDGSFSVIKNANHGSRSALDDVAR